MRKHKFNFENGWLYLKVLFVYLYGGSLVLFQEAFMGVLWMESY